jgi:parallel beta-helix repeat protein
MWSRNPYFVDVLPCQLNFPSRNPLRKTMNLLRYALAGTIALSCSLTAAAATLCVTASGGGCYHHIGTAVAAAKPGDTIVIVEGTFHEQVTITKPLSLTALENAVINASGYTNGVFVDGMSNPGLASVHISNLTIKNAKHEGILVLNASYVSVSDNTVKDNNTSLAGGNCPDLPTYEPGEAQDCGEGIHLQAVDHSIVTNNTVTGNAGGILISDDSGPTHDNLISFNNVHDNPNACGITMASHVPAPSTGAAAPFGVYHNTVFGNRSLRNGAGIGGGAGFGIFASIPGAKTYGNVVVSNFAKDNGHPGIAMHAHAPEQQLSDNMLVGNTLIGNGADTGDAATAAPTGINVFSGVPTTNASGNILSANTMQDEGIDVAVKNTQAVTVQFNNLLGKGTGVANLGTGAVDATNNWWGCIFGPTLAPGLCSKASGAVSSLPWLLQPAKIEPAF